MKHFLLSAFALCFFLVPQLVKADFDYVACDFAPYDDTVIPCSVEGTSYDGNIRWSANNTYFYNIFYNQSFCDVSIANSRLYITCDDNYPYASYQFNDSDDTYILQGTNFVSTNFLYSYVKYWEYTDEPIGSSDDVFELNYSIGLVNEDWTEQEVGCDVTQKAYCGIATTSYAMALTIFATSTVAPWKYEYQMFDIDGNILEPQTAFALARSFSITGSVTDTHAIIFPDTRKRVYLLKVCTAEQYDFPIAFGIGDTSAICVNQWIGNGFTDESLGNLLLTLGKITSTSTPTGMGGSGVTLWNSGTAWESNGCEDIGLTDVFKGVKCAMIWAFSPTDESIQKFLRAKETMLTIYPIGYGTIIMRDITTAFSTSTPNVFTQEIPVKELFGLEGGTTTIDMQVMLGQTGFINEFVDFIEVFFWLVFVGWLLMFSLTRKL